MSLIACVPFMADTVADACKETVQNCLVTTDFTNITQGTGGPTNKYCQLSAKTLHYNLKLPENCHKLSIAFWFYGINYGSAWQDVFSFSTQRADNQQTLLRFESYGNGNYGIFNNGHMSWDIVGEPVYDLQNKWTHLVFTIERTQTGTFSQYYENGILKWQNTKSYTESGDVKFYNTTNNFRIGEADLVFNVSDFRVYDHILSQKEVSDIYNRLMVQYQFGSVAQNLSDPSYFNVTSTEYGFAGVDLPAGTLKNNTTYTLSVNGYNIYGSGNKNYYLRTYLWPTGWAYSWSFPNMSEYPKTESLTFTTGSDVEGTTHHIHSYLFPSGGSESGNKVHVNWYKLEEGNKATYYIPAQTLTSIEDSSGHGFTGNITGSLITTSDSVLGLTSGYFNGSTVLYNNTSAFNFTDNFSWNIWVKHKGLYTGNATYIFTNGRADAGGYGYGMFVTDDNNVQTQFGNSTSGNMACAKNEWHMVSMTVSGTTVKSYVDGELKVTKTVGTKPTYSDGNGLGLGCFHYTGDIYYSQSNIDDFRIYGKALSDEEIKSLYTDKIELDNSYKLHSVEVIEDNNKVELTKESLVKCNEIYECGDEVRYIKFESNGSNKNSGNHLSRLIIYDMNNTEELILDSSIKLMPTVTSGSCVWSDTTWFDLSTSVTFDLGKIKKLTRMNVRRYWNDGRYYYATKIQVSKDNTNWVDVWVSGNTGSYGDDKTYNTYIETINGKDYLIPNNKYQVIDNSLDEYTQLEYIETTGTQYINLNYILGTSDHYIECKVANTGVDGNDGFIWCSYDNGYCFANLYADTSYNKWTYYRNGETLKSSPNLINGNIYNIKTLITTTNVRSTIDDVTQSFDYTAKTSTADTSAIHLFRQGSQNAFYAKCRLYSFKLYTYRSSTGKYYMSLNLIPAKNKLGQIGLYDMYNNKFYVNNGTGEFIAGKEISNKDIIMNEFIEE